MNHVIKDKIIQSLLDQKEIFGDELLDTDIFKKENFHKVNEPASSVSYSSEEWNNADTLQKLNELICECTKCILGESRNKFVFGSGNPDADVLIIGEGPGAEEDKQGLPFVGRAGQLLTDILKAIKFEREEVFIANIVKCRPPANRQPAPAEMDACIPYLKKQIELIKPKVILCLGLTAAQGLLKRKDSLSNLRGKVFDYNGVKTMVTFHPAALLRNPNWKRDCWEDVKKFRKLYEESLAS
jgi:uracil-DNA glycosylase